MRPEFFERVHGNQLAASGSLKQEPVLVFCTKRPREAAVRFSYTKSMTNPSFYAPLACCRRGGRLRLDGGAGQHLLSAARRQQVPVQPRRQPASFSRTSPSSSPSRSSRPLARSPAGWVRSPSSSSCRSVTRYWWPSRPRRRRSDRRPARPRDGSARGGGLRGARRGLGQPRSAMTSRSQSCGRRRLLRRVPPQGLDLPPVKIAPVPPDPIPVLIGGHSEAALRRAARLGDGWLHGGGDPAELPGLLARLARFRRQEGTADRPFEVHVISAEAYTGTACAGSRSRA